MTISMTEIALFGKGLKIAKDEGLRDEEFDPADYAYIEPPRASKAFMLLARNQDAVRRILERRVWTVRTTAKSATYFIQADQTWGTHIVYDIKCGGSDFVKQVLPLLYKALGSAIATKECETKDTKAFTSLMYHQVPFCEKTHKGATGLTWRVAFRPTENGNKTTWIMPRHLGKSHRGLVSLAQPPLCSHCISYSHSQHLCKWWEEGLVAGSKTTPDNFIDAKWIRLETAHHRNLGLPYKSKRAPSSL
ncbi:hypothetical protein M407DRAFT_27276 [Tulasnella calospora MUT 4182]|uniref:Uncharacterized protein n=1 Tax=Tulasnella calospora MUT 4182 TaxID=1051891 RepID=A0A0C3KP70_9AGAM|nr:hypothetical protein M407DRAFT_27276 [Tulasnella calospora MUT 4182]